MNAQELYAWYYENRQERGLEAPKKWRNLDDAERAQWESYAAAASVAAEVAS